LPLLVEPAGCFCHGISPLDGTLTAPTEKFGSPAPLSLDCEGVLGGTAKEGEGLALLESMPSSNPLRLSDAPVLLPPTQSFTLQSQLALLLVLGPPRAGGTAYSRTIGAAADTTSIRGVDGSVQACSFHFGSQLSPLSAV
jgi:hypothetical protein